MLGLLCGEERRDSGSIQEGQHKIDYSVGFQEDRLGEENSVLRNVEMAIGSREQAGRAMKLLLVEEALHKPCSQLSGGMKRRVALIRAMESA